MQSSVRKKNTESPVMKLHVFRAKPVEIRGRFDPAEALVRLLLIIQCLLQRQRKALVV